jgi:hypothetical protein
MSLNPRLAWLLFGGAVGMFGCDSSHPEQPMGLQVRLTSLEEPKIDVFVKAESYGPNGEIYMWTPVAATHVREGFTSYSFTTVNGNYVDSVQFHETSGDPNLTDAASGVPYNGGNVFPEMDFQGVRTALSAGIPADLTLALHDELVPQSSMLVLTAQPNDGFKFVRWTGAGNESTDNPLITSPISGGEYVGVFVKLKSAGTGGG